MRNNKKIFDLGAGRNDSSWVQRVYQDQLKGLDLEKHKLRELIEAQEQRVKEEEEEKKWVAHLHETGEHIDHLSMGSLPQAFRNNIIQELLKDMVLLHVYQTIPRTRDSEELALHAEYKPFSSFGQLAKSIDSQYGGLKKGL